MSLILNIEVTGKTGYVSLAQSGTCLDAIINENQMEHASFLQPAIKALLERNQINLNQLAAIAVSNGPGSYTGLRVGLAAGKGLAFALNIPLITVNTLLLMACATSMANGTVLQDAGHAASDTPARTGTLICPMIDARRMEVFFALYNENLQPVIEPSNAIIDELFLVSFLDNHFIIFTGSGSAKWQRITSHPNALSGPETNTGKAFAYMADKLLKQGMVSDLVNAEPFYCKEFYDSKSSTAG